MAVKTGKKTGLATGRKSTSALTITWLYTATGRKLQKRTCELLRSGSTPITISDVKRPNYIDQHRHQSERIKHISTNRTPAEATLDIIDYYAATNFITPKSPKGNFNNMF